MKYSDIPYLKTSDNYVVCIIFSLVFLHILNCYMKFFLLELILINLRIEKYWYRYKHDFLIEFFRLIKSSTVYMYTFLNLFSSRNYNIVFILVQYQLYLSCQICLLQNRNFYLRAILCKHLHFLDKHKNQFCRKFSKMFY